MTAGCSDDFVVQGSFERPDGTAVAGAAVHRVFLGDPPSNCGTSFDLGSAPARTDNAGQFGLKFAQLSEVMSRSGQKTGAWKKGCWLILAARDSRTIGYSIASGDELQLSAVRLVTIPLADLRGKVVDVAGSAIAGAQVSVDHYRFFVGRGPCPNAPVNFFLRRQVPEQHPRREVVADLITASDERGEFVIPQVPAMPGSLDLTISHPDFATLETEYYAFQPPMQLALQPAATVRIRLTLPDGRPATGLALHLEGTPEGAHWATHRDGVTDGAGLFAFGGIPAGDYTVRYFGGATGPVAVPAIRVARLAAGERREIDRQAVAGLIFRGRVLETASNVPVHHAEVRFESPEYPRTASTFQAAYTDLDGKFEFGYALAPGVYNVAVTARHDGKRIGQRESVVIERQPQTERTFFLSLGAGEGHR